MAVETLNEKMSRLHAMADDHDGESWDLSDRDIAAIREALQMLWNIAGTVVMACDSGKTELAQMACMEGSPLVGESRNVLAALRYAGFITDVHVAAVTRQPESK